jgi:hypothetical protein
MFNPSSDDVRRFFCAVFQKQRVNEILTPLETMAGDWIRHHPEYEDLLSDVDAALARDYSVDSGQTNPFLHLSMHLSIDEQKLDSAHEAQHQIMECLGEMIWNAQRNGLPLDGEAYIAAVQRRIR